MKKIIFAFICLFSSYTFGQIPFNLRYYLGYPSTVLSSVIPTDSCYYATGVIKDTIFPYLIQNIFVKFDLEGNPIFNKVLRSPVKSYQTWFNTLTDLQDGTFVLSGYSIDTISRKALLIKYRDNGDTIFTKQFLNPFLPDENYISPNDLKKTPDGGFIMVSNLGLPAPDYTQISIIKMDSLGNEEWHQIYGNYFSDIPRSVIVDEEGNIYVGSFKFHNILDNYVNLVFKLNPEGIEEWSYSSELFGPYQNGANDMILLEDGSLIIGTGTNGDNSTGSLKYEKSIFKLNNEQEKEWEIVFEDDQKSPRHIISHLIRLSDGSGIVAAGGSGDFIPLEYYHQKGWIGKISMNGDSIWTRDYLVLDNEDNEHTFFDLKETSDGGFILCGESISWVFGDTFPQRAWLLKLDQHGCLVPGCHIIDGVEDFPESAIQLSIYPNPTSDYLNVYLGQTAIREEKVFRIINSNGQLMKEFELEGSDFTFMVPVWEYAAGLYFLEVWQAGRLLRTEKFVVQR